MSQARNQQETGSKQCYEGAGDMFLRNVDWLSTDYTALYLFIITGVRIPKRKYFRVA
jgi:hypothetical protein